MDYEDHGGHCCGLSHVYGFHGAPNKERLEAVLKRAVEYIEDDARYGYEDSEESVPWRVFGHAVEITLTDQQMVEWAPVLKEVGFKHCFRWFNDNSGNYCNLLMWSSKKPRKPKPFKW